MIFNTFKSQRYNHPPYDFGNTSISFGNRHNGSDISAHLPFLEFLSRECSTVTEFGCRDCYSTVAFLSTAKKKVISYDIKQYDSMTMLKSLELPCDWQIVIQDTSKEDFEIEQTDFLFIDSLHTYQQVKKELRHHNKVNKYIGFHDIISQGEKSLDSPGELGIVYAINEFLRENNNWKPVYIATFNHGLLIIEKT